MMCPWDGCDYESNKMGVSVHHVQAHDESLSQTEYTCDNCGKTDTRHKSQFKGGNNYCSKECKTEGQNTRVTTQCVYCGTEFTRGKRRIERHENNFCSQECSNKFHKGENHPSWNGGTDKFTHTEEGREWRAAVFERDDYTCQDCGVSGADAYLNAHHIKRKSEYPELKADVSNGVTLCESCHAERHIGERAYKLIKGNINRRNNV